MSSSHLSSRHNSVKTSGSPSNKVSERADPQLLMDHGSILIVDDVESGYPSPSFGGVFATHLLAPLPRRPSGKASPLHTDPKQPADNDPDPFCLSNPRCHPLLAAIIIIVFNIFFVLVLVLVLNLAVSPGIFTSHLISRNSRISLRLFRTISHLSILQYFTLDPSNNPNSHTTKNARTRLYILQTGNTFKPQIKASRFSLIY
jgi:hypothetical protein